MPECCHCSDVRRLLARQGELLNTIVRLLEHRGIRDGADEHLLHAIKAAVMGTRFTSAEVFRHARVIPDLSAALEGADVDNAIQLGKLLKASTGCIVDGAQLERTNSSDREGIVWRWRAWQE